MHQSGPNIFWILTCFRYASETGNIVWLSEQMPALRLAAQFLLQAVLPVEKTAVIDQTTKQTSSVELMLFNATGSLFIDVFLREEFTTDTNAMARTRASMHARTHARMYERTPIGIHAHTSTPAAHTHACTHVHACS